MAAVPHSYGQAGVPVLHECYAAFECRVANTMDAGASTLFLADVVQTHRGTGTQVLTADFFRANVPEKWRGDFGKTVREAQARIAAEVREADAAPPALEPAMPEEQPVKPLIEAEEEQYDSTVSVADTLYAGPLPRRLEGDWTSGEFLRDKDLDVPPQAIQLGLPEYPEAALDAKATGSILVALLVDETGRVVGAEAMDAAEEFYEYRDRVAEVMRESTFAPGMRDGVAVKAMSFQRVYFALQVARPAASNHATRP
jgi:hypothetical protein